jgi:hypothetical protein
MSKSVLIEYEKLGDQEAYIEYAMNALTVEPLDKQRNLWYAVNAEKYLGHVQLPIKDTPAYFDMLYYKAFGYYTVAISYIWNGWYEEAFAVEEHFITEHFWDKFKSSINAYIQMLIIKKQITHLGKIFSDVFFKKEFMEHYEVYISLLVNPDYQVTLSWQLLVPIINKIKQSTLVYGD